MPRPRKYATTAEAAEARKLQERERKRAKRAPAHAVKADTTKRKDAFVNAKNWPVAPLTSEIIAAMKSIMDMLSSDKQASITMLFDAGYALHAWEEEHKLRFPKFIELDGSVTDRDCLSLREKWHRYIGTLSWVRDVRIPAAKKATRRHLKEMLDAEAAGLTVVELRNRREAAAIRKWKGKQADAALRASGERLLEKRAQVDAQRMEGLVDFGRF
jgi:hypothetical protein